MTGDAVPIPPVAAEGDGIPIECPSCGRVNDTHTEAGGQRPSQGDVGLCWGCRKPFIFELYGRALTPEELEVVLHDPDLHDVRHAMAESPTPTEAIALLREGD